MLSPLMLLLLASVNGENDDDADELKRSR